jgi:hypothetical protein
MRIYTRVLEVIDMDSLDSDQKIMKWREILQAIHIEASRAVNDWTELQSSRIRSELENFRLGEN